MPITLNEVISRVPTLLSRSAVVHQHRTIKIKVRTRSNLNCERLEQQRDPRPTVSMSRSKIVPSNDPVSSQIERDKGTYFVDCELLENNSLSSNVTIPMITS